MIDNPFTLLMEYVIYVGNMFYIGVKYMIKYAHHFLYVYIHASIRISSPQPFTQPSKPFLLQPFAPSIASTMAFSLVGSIDSAKVERIEIRINEIKRNLNINED